MLGPSGIRSKQSGEEARHEWEVDDRTIEHTRLIWRIPIHRISILWPIIHRIWHILVLICRVELHPVSPPNEPLEIPHQLHNSLLTQPPHI